MRYTKITVELIVVAEEAEAVVADLNALLDRMDDNQTIFGGHIETAAFEHTGTSRKSALTHTTSAGETAINAARKGLRVALRAVI